MVASVLMRVPIDEQRFLNLYGEKGPRLNVVDSIHYTKHTISRPMYPNGPAAWELEAAPRRTFYERTVSRLPRFLQKRLAPHLLIDPTDITPPIQKDVKQMNETSLTMHIFSWFMFGAPMMHIEKLLKVTVDGMVHKLDVAWFTQHMVEEWKDITLYVSTFLLHTMARS